MKKRIPPKIFQKPAMNPWIIPLFFLAAGFLVYSNTLNSGFHFDDFRFIVENPSVRSIQSVLLHERGLRQFTFFTFALNYAISGVNPFSYHLFNILLHVLNAVLVYLFVKSLMKRAGFSATDTKILSAPALAGLVFLLHPSRRKASIISTRGARFWPRFSTLRLSFFTRATEKPENALTTPSLCWRLFWAPTQRRSL